jgi:hypothetical protein
MTGANLRNIFLSTEFKTGLEELSSYLASIMQEAPIVHLLAKCLWKQKHLYALERINRHDLTVWPSPLSSIQDRTTIEFKFNFDTCAVKLDKEMMKLRTTLEAVSDGNPPPIQAKGSNWDVIPKIFKDVYEKKPNMFVWIICSRDLQGLDSNALERIVNWKPLKKYRRLHPYQTDCDFLLKIDGLLQLLQLVRPCTIETAEVATNGYFPSIYHFRICEFARP